MKITLKEGINNTENIKGCTRMNELESHGNGLQLLCLKTC